MINLFCDLIHFPLRFFPKDHPVNFLIQRIDKIPCTGDANGCDSQVAKGRRQASKTGKRDFFPEKCAGKIAVMQQIYAKRKRGDHKDDFFRAIALNFDILEEQKEANGCEKHGRRLVSAECVEHSFQSHPEAEIRTRTESREKTK